MSFRVPVHLKEKIYLHSNLFGYTDLSFRFRGIRDDRFISSFHKVSQFGKEKAVHSNSFFVTDTPLPPIPKFRDRRVSPVGEINMPVVVQRWAGLR